MVARLVGGDGEDAAVLSVGAEQIALAAEAITPDLVADSPRVAGIAGVVATLNDLAATGARPLALLNTIVADEALAHEALAGVSAGADLYGVPLVGGHTTIADGAAGALSVAGVGRCTAPLRISRAKAGERICAAICIEGELVGGEGSMPFFSHLRSPRRDRAAADLALLPSAAEAGELWAARDVSMPGIIGSLIQMLEGTGLGCTIDLDAIPRPDAVPLGRWLLVFMSYGFLLVGDAGALERRFAAAALSIATVGVLDDTSEVRMGFGDDVQVVWDFTTEPLTTLGLD